MEAEHIAKSIKLNDRIGKYQAKNCALTTMKDYKVKLRSSHPCRLINSCKIQLRKVSKNFAEKVNVILTESLGLNQRKNTDIAFDQFTSIEEVDSIGSDRLSSWFDWFTSIEEVDSIGSDRLSSWFDWFTSIEEESSCIFVESLWSFKYLL